MVREKSFTSQSESVTNLWIDCNLLSAKSRGQRWAVKVKKIYRYRYIYIKNIDNLEGRKCHQPPLESLFPGSCGDKRHKIMQFE